MSTAPRALTVALATVLAALPLGAALAPLSPAAPSLVAADEAYAFSNSAYSIEVGWPTFAQSLTEGGLVLHATLAHDGHEGVMEQRLAVGDVFTRALDLVDDRFFVLPASGTTAAGDPYLTLLVSRTPVANDVGELRGSVTLTFLADAILHDYEFSLPNAAFVPSVWSTTSLAWDTPFSSAGSSLPDGGAVADDGTSLDPYGAWQVHQTYGVFVQDADTLVAHARLAQGDMVNYLADGTFRVGTNGSVVETAFTGFLDAASVGMGSHLDAHDAILFSDAATSSELRGDLLALRDLGVDAPKLFDPASVDIAPPTGPIPHVLVGVPDSGINPYHEMYYRPNLTAHPCTYIEDFPCSIPSLPLSVGVHASWEAAYAADKPLWDALQYGQWYWIPQTVFVAAMCEGSTNAAGTLEGENLCLIDDSNNHGTGTTSSIVTENPNVLIAFKEGNSATTVFEDGLLPIDIVSYSWGAAVPLLLPAVVTTPRDYGPFFVAASGNEGAFPVVLDTDKASQAVINVGAADGASRTEPGVSGWKTMDFVSEYCRPAAATRSLSAHSTYCGTSFAAPTFAGALSKIVLELRRESGYTGSIVDGMVDPVLGVSKWDVRDALNSTATYAPAKRFDEEGGVPVAPVAPAYQWGWGYVDAATVPAALACIRDGDCPEKDVATTAYMAALWEFRDIHGGWDIIDAMDCGLSGEPAACNRLPGIVQLVLAAGDGALGP